MVYAETHDASNRGDKSPRLHCCCDKTLVLGTQENLEEGKSELVSKFNMADQRYSEGVTTRSYFSEGKSVSFSERYSV